MLNYIDHTTLLVSDISKSKEYYSEILQLKCNMLSSDDKVLTVESENVHFFIIEDKNITNYSNQHLSFNVNCIMDVIHLLDLKKINYKTGIFREFKYIKYKWVEWNDPDGIRLECTENI